MSGARVLSVNRGPEAEVLVGSKPGRSGIDKRPASAAVAVGFAGLDGDAYSASGSALGSEQAVYAYAREDLGWWAGELRRELRNGMFGENLTTAGLDISSALIGETWRAGTAVVQVTAPRMPCATFKAWLDEPQWVRRFAAARRPGAYLRVLTPGEVGTGDDLTVLSRPAQAVTVADSMSAWYGDRDVLARVMTVEGRGAQWDEVVARMLARP